MNSILRPLFVLIISSSSLSCFASSVFFLARFALDVRRHNDTIHLKKNVSQVQSVVESIFVIKKKWFVRFE